MEYLFEHNCRLKAFNYVQKCTPPCMIFIEFAAFFKNRYSDMLPFDNQFKKGSVNIAV